MIKPCLFCGQKKEMKSNQKYCDDKCKKNYENSLRNAANTPQPPVVVSSSKYTPTCPEYLNETAIVYWNKIAPTVAERGHLNVLSEDAFAELCDLYSRLVDINKAINETNRSLLQIEVKFDKKSKSQSSFNQESALSDIKRKYSKLFLDYQKQFYLIPLSNRGNFRLEDKETVDPHDEFLNMGDK